MSEDKKSDHTEVHEEPRRMSEEDVKDYHGLTLNEQGEEYRKEAPQGGIHIEFIDVKAIPWWKKPSTSQASSHSSRSCLPLLGFSWYGAL